MNMNSQMKKFVSILAKSPLNSRISSVVNCPRSGVSCAPQGFTLLELLIVVSIIAILSVALVLVLDPAETLKKSRDAQRISDMSTIKTALGIYTTSTMTPYLGRSNSNNGCQANIGATTVDVFYSIPGTGSITDASLDGAGSGSVASTTVETNYTLTDGNGWIPVNFDSLIGGSPISNLPVDPVNTVGSIGAMSTTTLAYRYVCMINPLSYELNAVLESNTYTTGTDNKLTKDGGNNSSFYEVGTNLKILGTGNDF